MAVAIVAMAACDSGDMAGPVPGVPTSVAIAPDSARLTYLRGDAAVHGAGEGRDGRVGGRLGAVGEQRRVGGDGGRLRVS